MTKYRVLQEGLRFYPQKRGLFGWTSFYDEASRYWWYAYSLELAKDFIDKHKASKIVQIHPYP